MDRIDYTFLPQARIGIKPLDPCRGLPRPAVGGKVKGDSCASGLAPLPWGCSRGSAPVPTESAWLAGHRAGGSRLQQPVRQKNQTRKAGLPGTGAKLVNDLRRHPARAFQLGGRQGDRRHLGMTAASVTLADAG